LDVFATLPNFSKIRSHLILHPGFSKRCKENRCDPFSTKLFGRWGLAEVLFCGLEIAWRNYNIGIFPSALDSQNRPRIQFLGLSEGLAIAEKTLDNFVERAIRLYEQGPGEQYGSTRLGEYVERWVRWPDSGLTSKEAALQKLMAVGHPAQGMRRCWKFSPINGDGRILTLSCPPGSLVADCGLYWRISSSLLMLGPAGACSAR